jgi:hypothetical protein
LLSAQNKRIGQIAYALAGYEPPIDGKPWCMEAIAIYQGDLFGDVFGRPARDHLAIEMKKIHNVPLKVSGNL